MKQIKKERPVRSYSGEKWKTNKTNKEYLAKDFNHRCAYCDDFDLFNGEFRAYHVEHFAPKEKFPSLKYEYSNLLYACPYCNGAKSDKWPSSDPKINVVENKGFLDPCKDEYYENLHRNDDGSIGYDTPLGEYIFKELNLGLKRHKYIYIQTELDDYLHLLEDRIECIKMNGGDTDELQKIRDHAAYLFWRVSSVDRSQESR